MLVRLASAAHSRPVPASSAARRNLPLLRLTYFFQPLRFEGHRSATHGRSRGVSRVFGDWGRNSRRLGVSLPVPETPTRARWTREAVASGCGGFGQAGGLPHYTGAMDA